jgi:hypothetical protein
MKQSSIRKNSSFREEILATKLPFEIQSKLSGHARVAVKTVRDLETYMTFLEKLYSKYSSYYGYKKVISELIQVSSSRINEWKKIWACAQTSTSIKVKFLLNKKDVALCDLITALNEEIEAKNHFDSIANKNFHQKLNADTSGINNHSHRSGEPDDHASSCHVVSDTDSSLIHSSPSYDNIFSITSTQNETSASLTSPSTSSPKSSPYSAMNSRFDETDLFGNDNPTALTRNEFSGTNLIISNSRFTTDTIDYEMIVSNDSHTDLESHFCHQNFMNMDDYFDVLAQDCNKWDASASFDNNSFNLSKTNSITYFDDEVSNQGEMESAVILIDFNNSMEPHLMRPITSIDENSSCMCDDSTNSRSNGTR